MNLHWRGNKQLSKLFIPFIFIWAIFFGEILPVCLENLNCFPETVAPSGKESMFSGLGIFFGTILVYGILSVIFWLLFRFLNWKVVLIIAIILGQAMEFFLFRPEEGGGVNVAEDPMGAFLFFLIIWPILLILPYGIFRLMENKFRKR